MGLFSVLFGCRGDKSKAQEPTEGKAITLEEITARIDTAEGWSDIFLKITSDVKTSTTHVYEAKGLHKGKLVGLRCEVRSDIKAGLGKRKPTQAGFVSHGVVLGSLGEESDELIKALAELYGQPAPVAFAQGRITTTAFSLNEIPVDLDGKALYKLKLFFAENNEELYSELFLNIDTEKREIELAEKDESYREALIKVLSR